MRNILRILITILAVVSAITLMTVAPASAAQSTAFTRVFHLADAGYDPDFLIRCLPNTPVSEAALDEMGGAYPFDSSYYCSGWSDGDDMDQIYVNAGASIWCKNPITGNLQLTWGTTGWHTPTNPGYILECVYQWD